MALFDPSELNVQLARATAMGEILDQHVFDHSEGLLYLNRVQDCEPILEWNKAAAQEVSYKPNDFWRHAARIPNIFLEIWAKEAGRDYAFLMSREGEQFLHRKLNDPAHAFLRIWPGKLKV